MASEWIWGTSRLAFYKKWTKKVEIWGFWTLKERFEMRPGFSSFKTDFFGMGGFIITVHIDFNPGLWKTSTKCVIGPTLVTECQDTLPGCAIAPPPLYTLLFIISFKIGWIYSTIKYKIHVHIVWRPYSYHHIYTGWRFGLGLNQPNIWLWCETIFCGPHPLHAQTPRSLSKLKIKNKYLW